MKTLKIKGLAVVAMITGVAAITLLTGCGAADDKVLSESSIAFETESEPETTSIRETTSIQQTESIQQTKIIEDVIYSSYVGWTDEGLTIIRLSEHTESQMYSYECDKETLMVVQGNTQKYDSITMVGNDIILENEDGAKKVLTYDYKAKTLTTDRYCFYESNLEFSRKELKDSDAVIDGTYTATLEGAYIIGNSRYARGTYTVEAQFMADGTVEGKIRGERYFCYNYYVKDDIILYVEEDGDFKLGYYDKENDVITMNLDKLVFTR